MLPLERKLIIDDDVCVCACKCLSVSVRILFLLAMVASLNRCLRILACALGRETIFCFVSRKLTNRRVGRGRHQHRICIYILYTDTTTFKSIGR